MLTRLIRQFPSKALIKGGEGAGRTGKCERSERVNEIQSIGHKLGRTVLSNLGRNGALNALKMGVREEGGKDKALKTKEASWAPQARSPLFTPMTGPRS